MLVNDFFMSVCFGVSQLILFAVIGVMFMCSSYIIKTTDATQQDVSVATFVILFAAVEAGSASGYSPDLAAANVAVDKVF